MSVTFDVSKKLRSSIERARHVENIPLIVVTSLVFKFSIPCMEDKAVKPPNHVYVLVGLTTANEDSITTVETEPITSELHGGTILPDGMTESSPAQEIVTSNTWLVPSGVKVWHDWSALYGVTTSGSP